MPLNQRPHTEQLMLGIGSHHRVGLGGEIQISGKNCVLCVSVHMCLRVRVLEDIRMCAKTPTTQILQICLRE